MIKRTHIRVATKSCLKMKQWGGAAGRSCVIGSLGALLASSLFATSVLAHDARCTKALEDYQQARRDIASSTKTCKTRQKNLIKTVEGHRAEIARGEYSFFFNRNGISAPALVGEQSKLDFSQGLLTATCTDISNFEDSLAKLKKPKCDPEPKKKVKKVEKKNLDDYLKQFDLITAYAGRAVRRNADADAFAVRNLTNFYTNTLPPAEQGGLLDPNSFIQEVAVSTGAYSAKYGRFTGGVINVITKSGGNDFSGTARADLTPDDYGPRDRSDPGWSEPEFPYTFGGRIIKDRTVYFDAFDFNSRKVIGQPLPDDLAGRLPPGITPVLNKDFFQLNDENNTFSFNDQDLQNLFARVVFSTTKTDTLSGVFFNDPTDPTLTASGDQAEREYSAIEIDVDKRSSEYFFNSTYTYSRIFGNYSGLATSDEISGDVTGEFLFYDVPSTPPAGGGIYAGFRYTPSIELGVGGSFPTSEPGLKPFNQFVDVDRGFNFDAKFNIISITDDITYLKGNHTLTFGGGFNIFYAKLDNRTLENDFLTGSLPTNPGKSNIYGAGPWVSLQALLVNDFSGELNVGVSLVRRVFDLQNGGATVAEAKEWTWGYNLGAVIWHPIPNTPVCFGVGAEYRYVDDIKGRVNGGPSFDLEGQGQVNVTARVKVPLDGLFGNRDQGPELGGARICF